MDAQGNKFKNEDDKTSLNYLREKIIELNGKFYTLEFKKSEIEKNIFEFNRRYTIELSDIILQILQRTYEKLQNKPNCINEYNNAKQEYDDFKSISQENLKILCFILTESEKNELKNCFRKASKLTHPDMVAEVFQKEAEQIFSELKNAYDKNDLETVKIILKYLETGTIYFLEKPTCEKTYLIQIIAKLGYNISKIETELHEVKNHSSYKLIETIDNWDTYFASIKKKFVAELWDLENCKN